MPRPGKRVEGYHRGSIDWIESGPELGGEWIGRHALEIVLRRKRGTASWDRGLTKGNLEDQSEERELQLAFQLGWNNRVTHGNPGLGRN